MRNFKKVIALVLALALTLSTFTVSFAAEASSASKLNDMGLLLNVTDSELSTELTREVGVTMILKSLGYTQADADAAVKGSPFTDEKGWAAGWIALAAKLEITTGMTATTFVGTGKLTERQFVSFQLRALGYDTVKAWADASALAIAAGLVPAGTVLTEAAYTKAEAANVMFAALSAEVQGTTPAVRLIDKLIAEGVVTKAAAIAAGLVVGDILIKSATITGIKTVTVEFNQAVDTTKAVLKVKKGAAIYGATAVWNEAKTIATLTTIVNLPSADYTVEVTGLTETALVKAFTVKDVAATTTTVVSKTVDLTTSAVISFKVANQYGEDMKISTGVSASAYNVTQGKAVVLSPVPAKSEFTAPTTFGTDAKLGDVIRVTVTYLGMTAQANVTVVAVATGATIAFADVTPLKDNVRISVSQNGFVVPYTLLDQYGVAQKLPNHTATAGASTIGNVIFVSSAPATVSVDTFAVNDGKLTFNTGATAGTAVITAFINATGAIATFTVTVSPVGKVDSLAISAPTALVSAGEEVKLDLTAADQFGGVIKATDIAGVTFTTPAGVTATIVEGKLVVNGVPAGTTVITAKVGDKVVGSVTIVAEAARYISEVTSVGFASKFEVGAVATMGNGDFVAIDQYGRVINKDQVTFTVAKKATTDANVLVLSSKTFTAGSTAGSQVFTLSVTLAGVTVTKDFTLNVIATADITSYSIKAVPTIYAGAGQVTAHNGALTLEGKTAAGDVVVLKVGKATLATTSNAAVATTTTSAVTGVAEGTAVVALWEGSTKLAETTVTVSKVAPVVTTLKFKDAPATVTVGATVEFGTLLEVKDQYGVDIAKTGMWTSSAATKVSVDSDGSVTRTATGDVTIGYVSANGLVVTTLVK